MSGRTMTRPATLFACLYAKEFPAQALLRLRPELRSQPCVVMQGEPKSQTVCSLNMRARLLYLSHGMTRVEVDTFPNAVILQRSHAEEIAAKAVLLECASTFSPRIEARSENTALICAIDIAGTQSLFGPPEVLAVSLLQRVRAVGFATRIAISSNFETAVCVAKGSSAHDVIQVIPKGKEAIALAALPVTFLNLTERQTETFALWGIHTLKMLAALPEQELIARMGQDGKRLRQLARGNLPHLFQPVEPPFALAETMELDAPVELLESLLLVAGVMLNQLILRARAHILALAAVTISLTLDGGATHTRTVRPALPSLDKQLWIKLLHLELEAHPPQTAILAIALSAESGSTSKVQLGLFSPQLPEAARLDVTLARIRALVGDDGVGRAILQDTHALEGFRVEPFSVPSGDSPMRASSRPRVSMRQLRPPQMVAVTLRNSAPVMFFHHERHYTVERTYGPWFVDGGWWNPALWGFEQWDLVARAQDGAMLCCCMMRDLMRNQWQMAALYD
jgi:protein ImuB